MEFRHLDVGLRMSRGQRAMQCLGAFRFAMNEEDIFLRAVDPVEPRQQFVMIRMA